jgi:predicted RNA-binding Zn ribbon-like protein
LTEQRHIPEEIPPERPPFKLLGGWLCLDFIDTVNWDSPQRERERFYRYGDLVDWAQFMEQLTEDGAGQLRNVAAQRPAEAEVIYRQSIDLRATLHRIFAAAATGQSPTATDLATLNKALAATLTHARLIPGKDHFEWGWTGEILLERVLWPILRSAAELLTSEKLDRVGQCAGDSCGWLFLDTSRNRSRRWCEMEHCGNRAKARRHYRRQKRAAGQTAAES